MVSKLKDSVSQAKAEIVELKQCNSELQAEVCELKESSPTAPPPVADVSELHAKLNDLEDRSRRNNLKFEGVAEGPNENWEQSTEKILKIISDKLQISEPVEIERAHRIGKPSADRSRPIIARFLRHQDREKILKNSNKFKGTRIFINEDLCQASVEKRQELLPKLKKAREEGKIAFFSHTKLIIRNKPSPNSGAAGGEDDATENQTSYSQRLRSNRR